MTKTKPIKKKEDNSMNDERMKRDNDIFRKKLQEHKDFFEATEKIIELSERVMKEENQKIQQVKLESFLEEIQTLKTINKDNFRKMMNIVKQIEKINSEIQDLLMNEKDKETLEKTGKIEEHIKCTLKEGQRKTIETLNGKFITEKLLLAIPYMIEGIETNTLKFFREDFDLLSDKTEEKRKLIDTYYQYQSRIILTNQQVGKAQNLFFEILPKYQNEDLEAIDLTSENAFDTFSKIQEQINQATIDDRKLFEIATKIESQYKISFNYNEDEKELTFIFEKSLNDSQHILDISNPKIKELESKIEELQEQLEKKEDIQEEIEILSDFKPIPIENQYSFNDKVSKSIVKMTNNKIAEITKQGNSKKTKNEVMKVLIANNTLQTNEQVIDDFEELTFETIYSLLKKNQRFDIQMIKDQLTQQKGNRHKSEIDDLIDKAIQKGRTTMFQVEIPDTLKDTMKGDFDRMGIKEPFLPLREYYVIKGGQKKSVFELTSKSIYFDYVEAKNQLITKENKLLQFKGFQKNKTNLLLIKRISDRVQDMKYQQKSNKGHSYIDKIKLESLFERIDFNEDSIQEKSVQANKKRTIDIVEKILKQYQKEKIIKSFSIQDDITITLFPYQEK